MAQTEYLVTANADDYSDTGGGAPYLLETTYNNNLGINGSAHFKVDTTALPTTAIIDQVDVGLAYNSYSASRGVSKIFTITIRDTLGVQKANKQNITFPGGYVGSPTIHWENSMPTTFHAWINAGGKTWMSASVPQPAGPTDYRQMFVGAKELADLGPYDSEPRLRITYHEPGGARQVMIVGA